jgi:endonuclease G
MEACAEHLPFGMPASRKESTFIRCRLGYAYEYDGNAKIPVWVAYRITPQRALGCLNRSESFRVDESIPPYQRSLPKDYAKSGYDIGHMMPAADARWDPVAADNANIMSNTAPQLPGLNRAGWRRLEEAVRSWTIETQQDYLVYVGPIYNTKQASTIGRSLVVVPVAFYKVVINLQTFEALGLIYPHVVTSEPPSSFVTSIAEVQRQTGITLPVPRDVRWLKEPWAVRASTKRADVCNHR